MDICQGANSVSLLPRHRSETQTHLVSPRPLAMVLNAFSFSFLVTYLKKLSEKH